MFENSTINQASKSVYKSLQSRVIKTYGITDVDESYDISDKILQIHGMDKERFSIINQIEKLIEGKVNFNSIDDNSNKNEKTMKGILKEATNPIDKLIGYRYLYRQMADMYGKKDAKYLTGLMYDFTLALSDSTNILIPYCWAFDASKLITMGKPFGQLPSSPVQRVDSYISLLNEVIHMMSNHLAGAIAIGTFFIDIAHLLIVKENFMLDDLNNPEKRKYIKNQYQRFVHGINSLSRSGGAESPFTNVSLFDREKLKKLVGEEYNWFFMDVVGVKTIADNHYMDINYIIDFIIELQNIYMEFFDKGDPLNDGMPYRFPVSTLNVSKKLNKDGAWVVEDKAFLKSVCKKDIYRYNVFVSEGNKVASCCFYKDQKVLVRNSENGEFIIDFKSFIENTPNNSNTSIYHNGFWKSFKKVKVPYSDKLIKITTVNNKEVIVTKDHSFPVLYGDKKASDLTVNDYLMFSTNSLSKTQKYESLTYEQGFLIGCFLGDGSYISKVTKEQRTYTGINLSLNEYCITDIKKIIDIALKQWGVEKESKIGTINNNVYPLIIYSTKMTNILLNYVSHNIANNKYFNETLLGHNEDCRKGMLKGWYATDGGNSNRCYSTSEKLIYQMETLCSTLGIQTMIDISDRTDEKIMIRDVEYDRNYPLYCLRFYEKSFKSKDINYKWHNNSIFFKIKNIELIDNDDENVFCVEIKDDEPYFTLANGIITHNCRLLTDLDMLELASQANSFGAGGSISLGSHRVIAVNFMRLALACKSYDDFKKLLELHILNTKKILFAHKELLRGSIEIQTFLKIGWIQLDRLFSTVGIIGYVEAEETLKKKFPELKDVDVMSEMMVQLNSNVNDNNQDFVGCIFNIEQIPAESMSHRLARADRILFGEENVPYNIYANQFIPLWNQESSIWERIEKDGRYNKLITGGGIVHINTGEHITGKQAEKLIEYSIESGCEHFAITGTFCKCEDGHVLIGDSNVCAKCGKPVKEKIARTVGFFVPVSDMSFYKQEYDHKIRKEYSNGDFNQD